MYVCITFITTIIFGVRHKGAKVASSDIHRQRRSILLLLCLRSVLCMIGEMTVVVEITRERKVSFYSFFENIFLF